MTRQHIVCKTCGALYYADGIPEGLECTCKSNLFEFAEAEVVSA